MVRFVGKVEVDLFHHEEALWARVLESKYGSGKWWKVIKSVRGSHSGEGWFDKDRQSLTSLFLRLFLLSVNKEAMVRDMRRWSHEGWLWEIAWRFEWENYLIQQLFLLLNSVIIHHSLADSWVWEPCPTGRYTSKSAYLLLSCDSPLHYSTNIFVVLWRLKIPHKTSFLIWKFLRNRLPTKDNLCKRNILN
ncbi:hypothetical protein HKD37_14G039878 [Glycine soja]